MESIRVRDIMIPITDYAVVDENATLLEALRGLHAAQKRLAPGRPLHRAVLVRNSQGQIVGKLGHLAFLKALDAPWDAGDTASSLSRVGLSQHFLDAFANGFALGQRELPEYARRARTVKVKQYMHPTNERVDADASLGEAIHAVLSHQSLSLLVTKGSEVLGILRLSDVFAATTRLIEAEAEAQAEPSPTSRPTSIPAGAGA